MRAMEVRAVVEGGWREARDLRLRALAGASDASRTTLEDASVRSGDPMLLERV